MILMIILGVLWLAVLELNKNTLLGWLLTALVTVGACVLYKKVLAGRPWPLKAGTVLLYIAALVLILFVTWPPVRPVPAVSGKDPKVTEEITVAQGRLTGVATSDGAVEVFAGIPYAAPPVGELRFKEPQDPAPWDGVLRADTFAPMSMQPTNLPIYDSLAQIIGYHDYHISLTDNCVRPVSEDALYLNIWRPAGSTEGDTLPVLVYIHGGSLQTGQPWYSDYSGQGLAREGVIVVNMGYRLGVFGFLATEELAAESPNGTTGNYGLLDQIKALTWVRDNIAAFGGDPSNVTVAGESAGSACVSALCTSPLAKGLFRRAIMESSTVSSKAPAHSFRLLPQALTAGEKLMEKYGAKTAADLRALPAEKLVGSASTEHHITIDGYVLEKTPYETYAAGEKGNAEAVLHGFNAEEAAPFILFSQANLKNYEQKVRAYFRGEADGLLSAYPASTDAEAKKNWANLYSAALFTYGHHCLSRQAERAGVPSYSYLFSKENGRLSAWHSGEEVYCYGNIPADSKLYDESDRQLSRTFLSYFANFCRTGDPNGEGLPVWERSAGGKNVMELGEETGMREDPFLPMYGALDRLTGWEEK